MVLRKDIEFDFSVEIRKENAVVALRNGKDVRGVKATQQKREVEVADKAKNVNTMNQPK